MKKIVLASASERRKELIESIGLKFKVHPSDFMEKDTHLSPEKLVLHNAKGKAMDVAKNYKDALVIGVDTVVVYKNHIIGKPKDKKDAKRILKLLSGNVQKVISGVYIYDTNSKKKTGFTETTKIFMDKVTEKEINAYINTNEGSDKAAGYAIQGLGSLFIKKIEGDYFNVVGLPIFKFKKAVKKFGIDLIG